MFNNLETICKNEVRYINSEYKSIESICALQNQNPTTSNYDIRPPNKLNRNNRYKLEKVYYLNSNALLHEVLPQGIIVDSGSTVHVFKRASYFVN